MKQRCYYAKHKDFHLYGGRGVVVCARWKTSYPNFLQDMGRCPVGMTLERINSDGNYEPSNCRWATAKEQARNRRNTLKPEQVSYVRNSNIPCTALAVELGVSPTTITNIRNGVTWS